MLFFKPLFLFFPLLSPLCASRIPRREMFFKPLFLFFLLLSPLCASIDTITVNQQLKDGDSIVSKDIKFELGFFGPDNSSSSRYVGIWYANQPEKTVVWVANRDNPVNDSSGVLAINRYGNLVLSAAGNISIWSTNVSVDVQTRSTFVAQLLDSGNLVLFQENKSESLIWQSFDYPTDTLLPGMKIGFNWKTGLEWKLTSWNSEKDPGTGDYSFRVVSNSTATPLIVVFKGLSKYWRSDPGVWPNFVSNDEEMYYYFTPSENGSVARAVLRDYGLYQQLKWSDADDRWEEYWSAPKYRCDKYGQCGVNSICSPDNVNLFECECLPGYEPKSVNDWNQRNGSDGCVSKRIVGSKCGNGDGFVTVQRVKDPDASIEAQLVKSMSDKECEQACLNNCSCTAYMSLGREGRIDCMTWYDDLMDILVRTELGGDLYVRVDKIELGKHSSKSKGFLRRRGAVVIPIVSVLVALVLIIVFACWQHKKKSKTKDYMEVDELEETRRHPELQYFDLSTILAATDNFSPVNKLGQGGFGTVYKGQLPNGQIIAVKRLSRTSGQGVEEFKNEVALIARLQHRNLVKLLGCCIKGEERILVLEHLPNKSLDYFLFDHRRRSLLDWDKRFEIINGVARGILYLHQDSRVRIIHRDLKTSNILLDAEMNPKISDFGMARILHGDQLQDKTNRIVGTYGYMSPEYAVFGRFSTKSDVFSFGIILLEIVSSKKNNGLYQEDHSMNLIGHVWQLWREDRALEIVDSSLESNQSEEVVRCIQVGLLCVQEDPEDRPTMAAVVVMLSGEASPPVPKQPAFVFRKNPCSNADPSVSKESCSINDLTITKFQAR
ncbi:G-type lectin S-receptor-like serine/threonine-protein kinase RKS1 [Pyrus communis]|uniref:G-type lectin S-receptor-like serine/threonine-protein kinase RKS1 n=1 Tax=Pyrus communis TaxID=23211 RepID=UPI0035BF4DD6